MSKTVKKQGSCLCGAVKVTAGTVDLGVGACSCKMCRRWGGGPLLATDCGTDVTFEGGENIGVYDSSEWAERGFCKQCGSHLFYRLKQNGQHIVPAGLFDDESDFVLDHQVFIDHKPGYFSFAQKTHDMTAEEVFARFA